jgi:hypothetical protein
MSESLPRDVQGCVRIRRDLLLSEVQCDWEIPRRLRDSE